MADVRVKTTVRRPEGVPEPKIGIGGDRNRFMWLNIGSAGAFVYIIRAGETNAYKIGHARSVEDRLCNLQIGSHEKLVVVRDYWLPDLGLAIRAENAAHKRFQPWHIHGEWFRLTDGVAKIGVSLEIRETIKQPVVDGAAWREYAADVWRCIDELNEPLKVRQLQMAMGWI